MSVAPKILALAGSTRTGSVNKMLRKLAADAVRAAGGEATEIDLRDLPLPLYDGDGETEGFPENAKKLKQIMLEHQGLVLASPEYNSSISGVLKNAIDWVSRAEPGKLDLSAFDGKVAALMSASPSPLGGLRGLVALRSILGNIRVVVLPDQLTIAKAHEAFDAAGQLKEEWQRRALAGIAAQLVRTVTALQAGG